MRLEIVPVTLREALAFVAEHHRHSVPPRGHRFSVGLVDPDAEDWCLLAVGIAGRPVARGFNPRRVIEITRVTTLEQDNACSMLYGSLCRGAKGLGYRLAVTYTREGEPGISLKAAGFVRVAEVAARSWDTPSRRRTDRDERVARVRWERVLRVDTGHDGGRTAWASATS